MALNRGFLLTVLVTAAALVGTASAATYIVGDSFGWNIPPNGPATYTAWASRHVFRVGDVLVFNFVTGNHDVAPVTKEAFDSCSSTTPIGLATVGPTNFTLNSVGQAYYICTFGQHCRFGQKLAINVSAASSTSPAPAPAASSPPTPAPAASSPPAPTAAPTMAPTSTSPSTSPSISPSPSPSGAPSSAPTPSGGVTPPPAPASELTPGSPPTAFGPGGSMSPPPPPPSSATIASVGAPAVVFALAALGLVI